MITDHNSLKASIRDLKSKQAMDLEVLKTQFHATFESLKPLNLIKNTLHDIVSSPEIKTDLRNNLLGMVTGYVSKLVMVGASHNPLIKVGGVLLQQAISNVIANNSEKIIGGTDAIFTRFLKFRFKKRAIHSSITIEEYKDDLSDE